jgi:hypothetical protein
MQLASPIICFLKKAETIKAITKALEEKLKTNGRLLMVHLDFVVDHYAGVSRGILIAFETDTNFRPHYRAMAAVG